MKVMSAVNVHLRSPYFGPTAALQFVCQQAADTHTLPLY